MKTFLVILIALLTATIVILLNQYFFPSHIICHKITNYKVMNEKNQIISKNIYLKQESINNKKIEEVIIIFNDLKTRIHINFKYKLIGPPDYGFRNYKITKKNLLLFKENIFYHDGRLYKPYLSFDSIKYKFKNDTLVIETAGFLKKFGKYIRIEKK